MRRHIIGAVAALLLGLGGGAALVVTTAIPALADTTGSLCDAFGPNDCAGGDLSAGSLVMEKSPPGRIVIWHPTGGTWQGWPVGQLQVGSLCMRRSNTSPSNILLGFCDQDGTAWWKDNSGSHLKFGNRLGSQTLGYNVYFSFTGLHNDNALIRESGFGYQQFTLF
jgi:hypothetical protein